MKLHDALGVSPDASQEQIQKAYRRRAKKAHPDQGGDAGAFAALTGAYLVLRDPARRAHYERTGEESSAGVDAVRSAALSILGQAVQSALLDDRAGSVDFVKIIRTNLEAMNRDLAAQSRGFAAKRKIIEANAKRWKRKSADVPDVILSITESALRECERAAHEADKKVEIHAAAIEILDGYEYEHTPAKQAANGWIISQLASTAGASTSY